MTEAILSSASFRTGRWASTIGAVLLVHAAALFAIHQGMLRVPEEALPPQIISQVALVQADPSPQVSPPVVRQPMPRPLERTETRVLPKSKPVLPPDILHTRSEQATDKVAPVVAPPEAPAVEVSRALPTATSVAGSNKGEVKEAPPVIELPSSKAAYLNNPDAPYPPLSRKLGEDGTVILRVFVTASGEAGQVQLLKSSGFDRLDDSALNAVRRWRFVPGKRGGVPEGMWFNVPVKFNLE